jgi:hypothetical protein
MKKKEKGYQLCNVPGILIPAQLPDTRYIYQYYLREVKPGIPIPGTSTVAMVLVPGICTWHTTYIPYIHNIS